MPIRLTREQMEGKLMQAFPPTQTDVPVDVLDEIRRAELERAANTGELKEGGWRP